MDYPEFAAQFHLTLNGQQARAVQSGGRAVLLLAVSRAAASGPHPIGRACLSALCGVSALGAVNLLAPYTGVSIALNYGTAFAAVVLGLPGVTGMLFLQVLFL